MKEHKINTGRNRIQFTLNTPLVLNGISIFLIFISISDQYLIIKVKSKCELL